jgi:hypothetical protein
MKPQTGHSSDQPTGPACRLDGKLTGVALIGISLLFAICSAPLSAHVLPDINVWLLGLAPAVWLVIHLVTRGYRAQARPVAPASATATPAATHP